MVSPADAPRQVADRGDPAAADAEIAHALAVLVDDGAALEDQVVGLRPFAMLPLLVDCAGTSALRFRSDILASTGFA